MHIFGNPGGKNAFWRPNITWQGEENVTVDLKKVDLEFVKWIQLLPVVKYPEASTAAHSSCTGGRNDRTELFEASLC